MTSLTPPLAVSPSEAARLLGIGRTKLFDMISKGELASFKCGARRLIPLAELQRWVDRHAG
jgi:excisionase family DNA binding protein